MVQTLSDNYAKEPVETKDMNRYIMRSLLAQATASDSLYAFHQLQLPLSRSRCQSRCARHSVQRKLTSDQAREWEERSILELESKAR